MNYGNIPINLSIEKCIDIAKQVEFSGLCYRFEFEPRNIHEIQFAQVVKDTARGRYVELELSAKPSRSTPRITISLIPTSETSCLIKIKYKFLKYLFSLYLRYSFISLFVLLIGLISSASFWWILFGFLLPLFFISIIFIFACIDKKRFIQKLIEDMKSVVE